MLCRLHPNNPANFSLTAAAIVLVMIVSAPMAFAQAVVPENHPGFVLAEAIAAHGCVLHQDDVNPLLEAAGLQAQQFPMMAVPLMRDGYLAPSGEGTLTLVNWGLCIGEEPESEAADVDPEAEVEVPAEVGPVDAETE